MPAMAGLGRVAAATALLMVCLWAGTTSPIDALAMPTVLGRSVSDFYDPDATANGCGSQGADGIDVPDSFLGIVSFTDACDEHDACYGTEGMSRSACDEEMLRDTLEACGLVPGCASMAVAYYLGVRAGGGQPYADGQVDARSRNFSRARRGARQYSRASGDPHVQTIDGTRISFQAAGVFRVAEVDGEPLVQIRTYPASDHMSVITGVAMHTGTSVVTVQLDRATLETSVLVDGAEVTQRNTVLTDAVVTIGGLPGTTGTVSIWRPDGLQVEVTGFGRSLDMSLAVPERHPGRMTGLLVDGGGEGATQPATEGIDERTTTASYHESIRVPKAQSWFSGEGAFDYHDPELTKYPLPLPPLPADSVSAAIALCRDAGVGQSDLSACVYDVIVGGDAAWAARSALSATRARLLIGGSGDVVDVPTPGDLVTAVANGEIQAARALLDAGADPNLPGATDPSLEGVVELLALSVAVGRGDPAMVALLLEAGADANGGIAPGNLANTTPLDDAALAGQLEIMRLLLDAGASTDRGLFAGDTGRSLVSTLLSPEAAALLQGQ